MPFRPTINFRLEIQNKAYVFTPHPAAKGIPYGQTGRRATVYQVASENGEVYALKVFTQAFRSPRIADAAVRLQNFAQFPGLGVCQRHVLTRQAQPEIIQKYPDLEFAVLMPWVQGETWQEFMISHRSLPFDSALTLAGQVTLLFAGLEQNNLAHCDIAGPNVLVDFPSLSNTVSTTVSSLALVDVEEMYGPGLTQPEKLPAGTPGYDHRVAKHGLWSSDADRFAGAVMLAEILTRHDERIRQISLQEQYFDPGEMQQNSERYQAVIQVLKANGASLAADLFARAWFSQTLSECPAFSEWYLALNRPAAAASPSQPYQVTWRPIVPGGGRPVSNPPITIPIEQVKPMLLQAAEEGRWQDVLQIAPQILQSYPADKESMGLFQRAQNLAQLDQAIESLWQAALHSGDVEDWDICLRSIVRAQYQAKDVLRYEQLRQDAEHEREIAAQATILAQLVAESRWDEADDMRAALPLDHPRVAELFAQMDIAMGNQARQARLLKEARQAFQERNWPAVLRLCREGLLLGSAESQLTKLLEDAQKERDLDQQRQDDLEQAIDRMDVPAVRAVLQSLPKNHPLQTRAQDWLVDAQQTETALEDARRAFDLESFQRILAGLPENFLRRAELAEWASQAAESQQTLLKARARRDLPAVEALINKLPAGHPALASTQAWLHDEKARLVALEKARKEYDLERLAALLAGIPEDDPLLRETWSWLRAQEQITRNIQQALDAFDLEKMEDLLGGLPANHPNRKKLENWRKQELTLRVNLQAAQNAYDLPLVEKLSEGLPANHSLRPGVQDWLDQYTSLNKELQNARQNWHFEHVLILLETVEQAYPNSVDLREWALQARERHQRADELQAGLKPDELESLLAAWPPEDPRLPDRLAALADIKKKQQEWASRLEEAEAALTAQDFERLEQLTRDIRHEKHANPRLTELAELARDKLGRDSQARETYAAAQAALAQAKYAEALTLAARSSELAPENADFSRAADEMRQKLRQMAREFEAKAKWNQARQAWNALKQTATLAPGTPPVHAEHEIAPAPTAGLDQLPANAEGESDPVSETDAPANVLAIAREHARAGRLEQAAHVLQNADRKEYAVMVAINDLITQTRAQISVAEKANQWERVKKLWSLIKQLQG